MSQGVKTFALVALFFILTTSVVILAALPWLVGSALVNQPVVFGEIYNPKDLDVQTKELVLKTQDNLRLQAWEVPVENPLGVVIFLGGLTDPSVTAFWGHARQFAEWGYASLLLELRAHGASEGSQIALGYAEHLDVLAALDYLQSQANYAHVPKVLFGVDLGGAVAINSAGLYQEIAGIISIGSFSSWADLFTDNLYFSGTPLVVALLEKPFVKLYTLLKFGWENRQLTPQKQLAQLGGRPALLIQSRNDQQVSSLNLERLELTAPSQVDFWLREGTEHLVCQDFLEPKQDPEYLQRIQDFFRLNFGLQPLSL